MTPTPPTDGAAELQQRIYDYCHQHGAVSMFMAIPISEQVMQIRLDRLEAFIKAEIAAWGRTIESKLPEDDIDAELSARYDLIIPEETAGFRIAANIAHALLTAEIEAITKENE